MTASDRVIRVTSIFIILYFMNLINVSKGAKAPVKCTCGAMDDEINVRIAGGSVMKRLSHPFLAMVTYKDEISCGGSIIGPHHILSAAHCFMDIPALSMVKVIVGMHDYIRRDTTNLKVFEVKKLIKHENFKTERSNMLINDIAIIEINGEMEFNKYIKPICLPFHIGGQLYKAGMVAGWGMTEYEGKTSRLPRAALVSILSEEQCRQSRLAEILVKVPHMFSMALCAYSDNADACQGDSGGPLYINDDNDNIVQLGIVSFGVKCGSSFRPGLYTKITNYLGWLKKHLGNESCSVAHTD